MSLIYIVEDDDNIREIEEYALVNANHNVKSFSCAKDFYNEIESVVPDLCMLDIMLPDEDGNTIVSKLRKNNVTKNIPIIMVTAKTSDIDLARSIEGGADDYIKKPFSIMELLSRVKSLLRRNQKQEQEDLQFEELYINNAKHEVTLENKKIELTYKEYELLSLLVKNRGVVLNRESIMDQVWGNDYVGESRTIDMHIKTLRQKLGSFGEHIKTIRNVGYIFE